MSESSYQPENKDVTADVSVGQREEMPIVSLNPTSFRDESDRVAMKSRPRPPKLYRIGDLADYSRMSRQTIHNYTTMGLLRESRWTHGGHRLYDESAFDCLDVIAELKSQNRTLEYIRDYFSEAESVGSESAGNG
jgi:hypothetical protein